MSNAICSLISAPNTVARMKPRRPLTQEESAEAARLKTIYEQRKAEEKAAGRKLTQDDVAAACGWSGQSAFSQFANGKIPLNIDALYSLARALKFKPEDVSPRLTAKVAGGDPEAVRRDAAEGERPTQAGTDGSDDFVQAPFFEEAQYPDGSGRTRVVLSSTRWKRLSRADLARESVNPANAAWITVLGNSMEMALPHGSSVAIDRGDLTVIDGKIYGIDHAGQLRVKQLYRLPGGGIRMHSFNSQEHRDEEYSFEQMRERQIVVLGRAFLGETFF